MTDRRLALHAAIAWLAILLAAVGNGALRELLLVPALGVCVGNAVSGVVLIAVVVVVACVVQRRERREPPSRALAVGAGWLVATLAFEFGFGRLVRGASWSELLGAYTFADCNLWPLVLAVVLVAPWACGRICRPSDRDREARNLQRRFEKGRGK